MNFNNCGPYFYYLPGQQYNIMEALPFTPISEEPKTAIQEELNSSSYNSEEKLPSSVITKLDLK
jgi:hypothetical protein